jgi:5-methylcytosine-specific restriction protein A
MPVILCRVVWADTYQRRDEEIYAAKMSNPDLHGSANERLNFANEGGYVYGFVERNGGRIALEKLGASKSDPEIDGVTVIWFAVPREDNRPRIVGWYENATAYRNAKDPERASARGKWQYNFKARYEDAYLVPVSQRFLLEVPAKQRRTDRGYIGERFWFYPETSPNYTKFLESFRFMTLGGNVPKLRTPEERIAYEEGQRYLIETMVSARNHKLTAAAKAKQKFTCQACGFNFKEFYGVIGDGFIEAHHKIAISSGLRASTICDIDVLCANCHRMVHRENPPVSIERLRRMIRAK